MARFGGAGWEGPSGGTLTLVQRTHGGGAVPSGTPGLTVVVADGDARFAHELAGVLGRDPRIELVEAVSSADETLAAVEALHPDLVLMGELPGADLRGLTSGIARTGETAVILLVHPQRVRALPPDLRVAGFLRREGTAEEVLQGFFEIAALALHIRDESRDESD